MSIKVTDGDRWIVDIGDESVNIDSGAVEVCLGHRSYVFLWISIITKELQIIFRRCFKN